MPEVSERVFHTGSDISGATGETLWLRCARSGEPRALWFLEGKILGAIKSSSRPLVQRLYLLDMWQDRRSFLEPFLGVHNSSGTVGSNRAPVSTDFSNCYSLLSLLSVFLFSEVSFCFFFPFFCSNRPVWNYKPSRRPSIRRSFDFSLAGNHAKQPLIRIIIRTWKRHTGFNAVAKRSMASKRNCTPCLWLLFTEQRSSCWAHSHLDHRGSEKKKRQRCLLCQKIPSGIYFYFIFYIF